MDAVVARNKMIEKKLNSTHTLPRADVYPLLGDTFSPDDLSKKILRNFIPAVDYAYELCLSFTPMNGSGYLYANCRPPLYPSSIFILKKFGRIH